MPGSEMGRTPMEEQEYGMCPKLVRADDVIVKGMKFIAVILVLLAVCALLKFSHLFRGMFVSTSQLSDKAVGEQNP